MLLLQSLTAAVVILGDALFSYYHSTFPNNFLPVLLIALVCRFSRWCSPSVNLSPLVNSKKHFRLLIRHTAVVRIVTRITFRSLLCIAMRSVSVELCSLYPA